MKRKILLLIASIALSACSFLSSSPSSVVKKLISSAEAGDVDTMVSLWGTKAVQEQGAAKLRDNAQHFADTAKQVKAAGEVMEIKNMRETIQGDRARVFFIYHDQKGSDSICMGFALLKENGKWTLYRVIDCSDEDRPFDSSFAVRQPKSSPSASDEKDIIIAPPPPPSPARNSNKHN